MSIDDRGSNDTRAMLRNPAGMDIANYPKNTWWVAATSDEVTTDPYAVWMLDVPVVIYRRANGEPVALDNRCPHRAAPLSSGYVSGDRIVCGYHGFEFAPTGACEHIPTQDHIPVNCAVRSFPVVERAPLIWVWMGDPALCDEHEGPPDLPWALDPGRVTASGRFEINCNYMALKENVLDLSHFGFVHAKTLGITDWTHPPVVETNDRGVTYSQMFDDLPLPAMYGVPTGIGCERKVDRRSWGTCVSPALHLSGLEIVDHDSSPGARRDFSVKIAHITTPIDPASCHYWWFFSQDYGHAEGASHALKNKIETAFLEDKQILEATEALVRRDPRGTNYAMVGVDCDEAGLRARRMISRATTAKRS